MYSKNFVLQHTILYVYCVDLLIQSLTQLDFPFYNFSLIYYDFSKLLQGGNLTGFEKFRGGRNRFIGWGVMSSTPIGEGVIQTFSYVHIRVSIIVFKLCSMTSCMLRKRSWSYTKMKMEETDLVAINFFLIFQNQNRRKQLPDCLCIKNVK